MATASIVSCVNTTKKEAAATISIDDLRAAGNQIDTELTQTIPLGDSLVPVHPDQPLPEEIGYIRLTLNETLRLIGISNAGLSQIRTAFHLRWSRWRRQHQAIARWHHYRARLAAQPAPT